MLLLFPACYKEKAPEQRHYTVCMYLFDSSGSFVCVLDELTETNSFFKFKRKFINIQDPICKPEIVSRYVYLDVFHL